MISNTHILSDTDNAILAACVGKALKYIEGRDSSDFFGKSYPMLNEVARLVFDKNNLVEIRCNYVKVDIAEDSWDDTGAFSAATDKSTIWLPEDKHLTKIPVNKTIEGIIAVNDYDELSNDGRLVSSFAFTNAIALNLGDEYLVFTMDYFAEDVINVNRGPKLDELLPKNMGSWYEAPGWNDEFRRELVKIA